MRGDSHRARAGVVGAIQVLDRPDAGNQQRRYLGAPDGPRDRGDPLCIGVGSYAVIEAGSGQAVTVRDLDRVHAGLVERF